MARTDGDITLSVDIEPGDVKDAAQDIREELREIFDASYGEGVSDSIRNLQVNAAKLYESLGGVLNQMAALEGTQQMTPRYAALSKELDELTKKHATLEAREQRMWDSAKTQAKATALQASAAYKQLTAEIHNTEQAATQVTNELVQMKLAGTDSVAGEMTPKYAELTRTLNHLTNRSTILRDRLADLTSQELDPQPRDSAFQKLGRTLQGVDKYAKAAFTTLRKLVATNLGKLAKSMLGLNKATRSNNTALQMGFKNFIRYGLGVRSLFALINKLRRALMEGLGNLAQYSSPFNAVMSQFVSSLATLQNAFATAFAPILSVVLPILSALMDALVRVITLIGQFFAALTGKGTFVRAKKVNKDYAGSLAGVGKSAGGASKGMNKANKSAKELEKTIAGFDDVEILHENKPTDSGSSGGSGGGGAGGVGGLNPNDMFETIEIESPIANMANRIRELIANQDWEGLGAFLGETINSVFRKAKDLISWDNLGERITFAINAVTTTFNSLIETIDWDLIGSTFAEGINTVLKSLNLFITGINWEQLGSQLMTGLNALIRDINWDDLGLLFANGVNALFDFLYGALSTFDWKTAATKLTSALNTFIRKTDWKKVGKTLSELLNGALQFLFQALATFDWAGLGKLFLDLLLGVDWAGLLGAWYTGIAQLFGLSLGNLANLVSRLFSGMGSLWQMVMTEEGRNTIAGFFAGILEKINGIPKWLKTNLFDPFIKGFESVFQIGSPSKVMKREGNFVVQGFYNGVSSKWKSVKSFFSEAVNGITSTFKNTDWKESGSSIVQKLNSGVSGRWSKVSSFFNSAISAIKQKFSKTNWAGSGQTLMSKLQSGIVSRYNSLKTTGGNVITKIKSGMSSKWSSITTFISGKIDNLKSKFDISKWVSLGANIVGGIKKGLDDNWHKVNSSITSHSNSAVKTGEHTLQVKSPSRVFRDRIGKMIPAGVAVGIDQNAKVALNAVNNMAKSLSNTQLPELTMPPIAMGQIIPPSMQRALTDDGENTLKRIADVLQYNQQQAITRDELITILNTVLPSLLEQYVNFYIGDEQVARHAKAGNVSLNYRFNINR